MFEKKYIENGDRVFATGVFLIWDDKNKTWIFDGFEEATYGPHGLSIDYDEKEKKYYEEKEV